MVYQEAIDAGNQAFADEDFDEAIKQYSSALVAKPGDVNALLLRANAYMKCDRAQDAVADCDTVLQHEPANQKALFRKGTAQLMLSGTSLARTATPRPHAPPLTQSTARSTASFLQRGCLPERNFTAYALPQSTFLSSALWRSLLVAALSGASTPLHCLGTSHHRLTSFTCADFTDSYRSFKKMTTEQGKRWARKSVALMDKKDLVHVDAEDAGCVFVTTLQKAEFKEHDKLPAPEFPCAAAENARCPETPRTGKERSATASAEKDKSQEAAQQPPQPREKKDPFRVDWYQNVHTVTIDVFIKGLAQDAVSAEVDGRDLSIEISLGDGKEYNKSITLFKRASVRSVRVMPSKASVELTKAEDGQWSSLEAKTVRGTSITRSTRLRGKPAPSHFL